jgi:hypothetical protein
MTDSQRTDFPAFAEHRVQRDRGSVYVRDFPGGGHRVRAAAWISGQLAHL